MSLQVVTTRSIDDTDLAAWAKVCDPAQDLSMNPEFLQAVEASMGVGTRGARATRCETRFWYLLTYDEGRPVGAACVTEYPVDTMVFASPLAQRVVGGIRRLFPRYLKFRVTFCGLPVSIAGSNLRVVAGGDAPRIVGALHAAIEQISRERKTLLVVYKELNRQELALAESLQAGDFVRAESLPMNRIANQFGDFEVMLAAMRSHYRYKIARSRRKFSQSALTLTRTTGRAAVEPIYTPALHAMYERVALRSEHRLEVLPREFFLELAERFPDELVLTTISEEDRVLAFAWSLCHGSIYRNLFVGVDYDRNEETDAYFNLMIEDIAHGLEQPVDEIFVGQSADDFKSRLGCAADPRFLLIQVTNGWLHWCFLQMQSSFLTPPARRPQRDVFKTGTLESATASSAAEPPHGEAR